MLNLPDQTAHALSVETAHSRTTTVQRAWHAFRAMLPRVVHVAHGHALALSVGTGPRQTPAARLVTHALRDTLAQEGHARAVMPAVGRR